MNPSEPSPTVRIGTSGWSYPKGPGTWNGIFYPPRPYSRSRRFDELEYYARYFDTVEVNSSFYRPPSVAMTRGWVERTPPGFDFSLKLYQKFTHPEMFHKATGRDPFELGAADVDEFRAAIAPIAEAGKLGALLAQFPASFQQSPDNREYLRWLLEAFHDYPVAVELRHRSWSDHAEDTTNLLNEFGAAWTQIDEPKFRLSIRQTYKPNVRSFYYMRLHGRNADKWWRHATSDERYDYLYSPDELKPFADVLKTARRKVGKVYMYLNNHFAAKAVANAAILKHELDQPVPGEYPSEMVERYPELKGIVSTTGPAEAGLYNGSG